LPLTDILFLGGIVVLSTLSYVRKLGFYSDDWAYLGSLFSFGDYSNAGRSTVEAFDFSRHVWARPTQAAYQWVLFQLFGTDPLGYHVINALVILAMVLLFYLVLREFGVSRPVSVGAAAVMGTMPNFSTDRFWFAAFGYALTMAAGLLAVFSSMRALRNPRSISMVWKTIGVIALVVLGLGYEVALAPVVFALSLIWWRTRSRLLTLGASREGLRAAALILPEAGVIIASVAYKAITAVQAGIPGSYSAHLARVGTGAITTNVIGWGVDMPRAVRWAIGAAGPLTLMLAAAVLIAVFAYLYRLTMREPLGHVGWGQLVVVGVVLFVLGYAIFATNARILFTTTGIGNRVSIAASAGVAIAGVALIGLLMSRFRPPIAAAAFSLIVALWAAAGTSAVATLAEQWGRAWARQQQIIEGLEQSLPKLPRDSAVILAGVCPYEGSAIVFESNWDLAGALEIAYEDPTVKADVATRSGLQVGDEEIRTVIYGSNEALYPYDPNLIVYNHRTGDVGRALDPSSARAAIGDQLECSGRPGLGETILPADALQRRIEDLL
jgi:hypothetical protein